MRKLSMFLSTRIPHLRCFVSRSFSALLPHPDVQDPSSPPSDAAPGALFEMERVRQISHLTRFLEKIRVRTPEGELLMNKGISTPEDCARHFRAHLVETSAVALVQTGDNSTEMAWDMKRPLETDCQLDWLPLKTRRDPQLANQTFWRSCSVLLGAVLKSAFKSSIQVNLCAIPPSDPTSGSFLYDISLTDLSTKAPYIWTPTSTDLRALSVLGQRLALDSFSIDRLEVNLSTAEQMFAHSPHKLAQLPLVAEGTSNGRVIVYRLGDDHLELSSGPLLGHIGLVGRFQVTGWFPIESPDYGPLVRVQGVALPTAFLTHCATWELLARRASKFNPARIPTLSSEIADSV